MIVGQDPLQQVSEVGVLSKFLQDFGYLHVVVVLPQVRRLVLYFSGRTFQIL